MPGPFLFAWMAAPIAFDPLVHAVEDEAITELQITQSEGDFAGLTMTVINPGTGLLAPGRVQWCWLSWDDGEGIVPLFTGRLVAVPESIDGEAVRLLFAAKPPDYDEVKASYAESLKTLPYYDPIWIAAGTDDPDAVLNGYGAQWHIARDTLELTHSDELLGEDGTLTIGEADHTYDNFGASYSQPPLSRIDLEGTVAWRQTGHGVIDVTWDVYNICVAHKSIYRSMNLIGPYGMPGGAASLKSGVISSLTGEGLKADWPKPNSDFGGGWTVNAATGAFEAPKGYKRYSYEVKYRQLSQEALDRLNQLHADPSNASLVQYGVTGLYFGGYSDYVVQFPISAIEQFTLFDWAADRGRVEVVRCSMAADIQALLAEPENEENIARVSINAQDTVTDPLLGLAIGDTRRASYLNTDRGNMSVQYLLLLGRAELRRRARAIEIQCRVPWATGIAATLRHNAHIVDRRLPSGEAIGKITGYSFAASGDGPHYVDLTIGCAIGHRTTVTAAAGTPEYVELGYVDAGYQAMTGAEVMLPTGDLVYQSLDDFSIDDDGVNLLYFDRQQAIEELTISGGMDDQIAVVNATSDPIDALGHYPTRICFKLVPVAGMDFETAFMPAVQPLPIPQQINLEA
jgi:hypothetical protein